MYTVEELNDQLIELAFSEDIGDGDHTTLCCIPADAQGKSRLLIKEEGILAGVRIAREVFRKFDPTLQMEVFLEDGAHVKPGDVAFVVSGKTQSLLQTERLMLNIMQRMSGSATMTQRYVKRLEGTGTRVLNGRDVKKLVIACDAGMGSSVMVASSMKKRLAPHGVEVSHSPVNEVSPDTELIMCQSGLADRARNVAPNAVIITFEQFLGDPAFARVENAIKSGENLV